jgi:PTH1 family peptidyl-tRNA hydrolase
MRILCGLGNPGAQYNNTRHNAGFIFLDAYARKHDFPEFSEKWNTLVSEKGQGDEKVILVKPLTFMNKSGEALQRFVQFYKCPLDSVFLIYDDIDLPLGQIRFKEEGSAGTHNGMKSIIQCLGSSQFPRLRLGIESRGESAPKEMDLSTFVLAPFKPEEEELFEVSLKEGLDKLEKRLA